MYAVIIAMALLQSSLAWCSKIGFVSVSPISTSYLFLISFCILHSSIRLFPLSTLYLSDSQSYCRFWEEELEREL